ncbi:DUF4246 domain-containing protein [Aspergillus tanneri]|uniref:DUF4246 domain-containing protein n=1 Tax=Aspergillus tanneri TaxID=1220188 RepID=A0A5M9MMY8_9EURO|nr:uncharacterized protein ATNIH1004_008285 [Aspergillus tanneri]KAA8644087.1 hypothetical protein ATNIH1004_008285 [Aspergillus tanneri]
MEGRLFNTGVVKSDTSISEDLKRSLREAVRPLEDVPEKQKDYHRGSDRKVVDLVHPVGQGEVFSLPPKDQATIFDYIYNDPEIDAGSRWRLGRFRDLQPFSRKFQWMPCDVEFTQDGGCHIVSYINSLHPNEYRPLCGVRGGALNTTSYERVEFHDHSDPEPKAETEEVESEELYDRYEEWESFAQKGLQVIFKLANIELAPEKPDYEGGIWHVEGQMHICATTLCYYDSENITENNLSFRQRAETDPNNILYPQGRHEFLYKVFGFGPDIDSNGETHITQHLGSVSTHEGRLLAFPNILQHRVSPFSLADRSKPGLRKILALFLVLIFT